ncbi:MAG: Gfo/Idh/MocA family oxidoreductase [Acidobacteria bacterium]|nr:Gfo/Idh/MocA family oxidoreductase [Acidobacteriota bacterium]
MNDAVPLKGTLAGCGFFAQFQMEAWNRMSPQVEIAAVCDLDPDRAQAFAHRYGIPLVYTDFAAMLAAERPHFVDVVTRPDQHLPMARIALAHGVHVLCQKPLAPTLGEAEALVSLFPPGAATRMMVNENWRFQAWYREIKRLLDSGALGTPFSFRWVHRANDGLLEKPYPNQPYFVSYPRFLIFETLVHYLDSARYLFGDPQAAACMTAKVNPTIAGEDQAIITLRFGGSFAGIIDGNRCSPMDEAAPEGSHGMGNLRIDATGGTLWLDASGHITIEPRGGQRYAHVWPIPPVGYRGDSCYNTQLHFAQCLRSGAEFESHGADYLRTLQLVESCYLAAATGITVATPCDAAVLG